MLVFTTPCSGHVEGSGYRVWKCRWGSSRVISTVPTSYRRIIWSVRVGRLKHNSHRLHTFPNPLILLQGNSSLSTSSPWLGKWPKLWTMSWFWKEEVQRRQHSSRKIQWRYHWCPLQRAFNNVTAHRDGVSFYILLIFPSLTKPICVTGSQQSLRCSTPEWWNVGICAVIPGQERGCTWRSSHNIQHSCQHHHQEHKPLFCHEISLFTMHPLTEGHAFWWFTGYHDLALKIL